MGGLKMLGTLVDGFASRSPRRALAQAGRLAAAAPERALALYAAAAKAGDAQAAFITGECYLEGKGTPRFTIEAARWFHVAASAGHVDAQCRLATLHLSGLPKAAIASPVGLFEAIEPDGLADYYAALPWAKLAAEAGAADAQAMLAHILTAGPETLRDPAAALIWYEKSAAQDHPQGRLGYGIALMLCADTPEKIAFARTQLLSAAQAGLPAAHYLLGFNAERAIGTTADIAQARQHYQHAAQAGNQAAQARLGVLLLEGLGGPVDTLNGETWLRRAALSGDPDAAARLGEIYATNAAYASARSA